MGDVYDLIHHIIGFWFDIFLKNNLFKFEFAEMLNKIEPNYSELNQSLLIMLILLLGYFK